jgi:hypothetical protein
MVSLREENILIGCSVLGELSCGTGKEFPKPTDGLPELSTQARSGAARRLLTELV